MFSTLVACPFRSPNQFVYNGDLNEAGMPRSFCKLKKNAKNNIFNLCVSINDEEIQNNYPFEVRAAVSLSVCSVVCEFLSVTLMFTLIALRSLRSSLC